MAEAKKDFIDEFLYIREIQGLKLTNFARLTFLTFVLISFVYMNNNYYEFIVSGSIVLFFIITTLVFIRLLFKEEHVHSIGYAGTVIDILLIAIFPIFFYLAIGGPDTPAVYITKNGLDLMIFPIIAFNAFAIRPAYPAIVSIGSSVVILGITFYVLADERTVITNSIVNTSDFHMNLFLTSITAILGIGAFMMLLTYIARKMVYEAARLEKANVNLERYFSPNVAKKIAYAGEDFLKPGGKSEEVAVLFCDLRGFTALSERLSPDETVRLLSQYHSLMVEIIFKHNGTLDKFIGDGIMATFGTPEPSGGEAIRAVLCAVDMQRAITGLGYTTLSGKNFSVKVGIGINFGSVIVGNVGTRERLEYTVIGDTVNVASRIEDATKELVKSILVSDTMFDKIKGELGFLHERGIGITPIGEIPLA